MKNLNQLKTFLRKLSVLPTHGPGLWSVSRMLVLASLVGIVAGLGAITFQYACHFVSHYSLDIFAGYHPTGPAGEKVMDQIFPPSGKSFTPYALITVITIGGLISGLLIYTFAPEAEGHGTDAAISAYHKSRGIIRPIVPILKLIASAITLGTGGSGGREGPIAQIGAGFGSYLGTKLKLSDNEKRILLAAGMGAGIGAIFRAPLAGAIFATEVLYREPDFEGEALIPSFISTTIAYCIFSLVFGFEHLFSVKPLSFNNPLLLGPLAILAVVMAIASYIYVKCFYSVHNLFKKLNIPNHIKPMIGAFLTGLIGLIIYISLSKYDHKTGLSSLGVLSFGYGFLQDLLSGSISADIKTASIVLLAVGLGKIVTTALTIGSGGSGGVFGPSMVIGGALGALVGLTMKSWFPETVHETDIFIILGMAGFFSSAANTPVSTLIMVTEMTASYTLLLPAMWVCAISYILGRGWTIYHEQVPTRLDSPAHRGDFIIDILRDLTVEDAWKPDRIVHVIPSNRLLRDLIPVITDSTQSCFPVIDEQGKYIGVFSLNDIRGFLYDNEFHTFAIADDLTTQAPPLHLDTDLSTAMEIFATSKFDELAIVDRDTNEVLGTLRHQDIISTYNAHLLKMKKSNEYSS